MNRIRLRDLMVQSFDLSELKSLCFDLNINAENFPNTPQGLVEALISYCERHNKLSDLIKHCNELRPSVVWPTFEEISISSNEGITLTRSREEVQKDIQRQIEVGKILLKELAKSPITSEEDLNIRSKYWHDWRRYSEQVLRLSFSSTEPLMRLKNLKPHHLDFPRSWEERAESLLKDIEQEIAFLKNLVVRLENYKE